ncbi:MAG: glycerophosphodiester phosphodiesterase [Oscillospiraceae bacterium]|nr:glycerophosphodiester phosphodiesterase [Oscillospiraceae bacterium]
MWYVLLVLLILLILCELLALALRCRRGHPDWKYLRLWRYAHRGYHDKPTIPENSMAAFRRAVENGFGAELDVHLMKDGRLAVIHDSSLKRTAGADVAVEDLTAEELAQYRLEGTDEHIPLLEEVLPLFEGYSALVVELKSERGNYDALAETTVAMLDRFSVRYCIESFDPRCLRWLRRHRPEIVRGQLSHQFLRHKEDVGLGKLIQFALGNLLMNFMGVPDFVAYDFDDRRCAALRLCRKLFRVQEIDWTIRSREAMLTAERDGALVIFERFDPRGETVCE